MPKTINIYFIILFVVAVFCSYSLNVNATSFDLDSDPPLTYAIEAVPIAQDSVSIGQSSDELNISFTADFSVTTDVKYIRIQINNGSFANGLPSSGLLSNPNYDSLLLVGGQIGDDSAIINLRSSAFLGPTTQLTLASSAYTILDTNRPLSLTYELYDTASDALRRENSIISKDANVAQFISGIGASYTRTSELRIDINEDFLRFESTFRSPSSFSVGDSTPTLASGGFFDEEKVIIDNVRHYSDSSVISSITDLLQNYDASLDSVSISGSFSSLEPFLAQNQDCSGTTVELSVQEKQTVFSLDELIAQPYFCLTANNDTDIIERTEFVLDLGFGLPPALLSSVRYNSSSIDFPYITDFDNLRQRLFIVNHSDKEVAYRFLFTSEIGYENALEVLDASIGIIPAKSTLKLNSTEIINILPPGPPRVSGRLYINARPQDISAATQLVSLVSDAPPVTNVLTVQEN